MKQKIVFIFLLLFAHSETNAQVQPLPTARNILPAYAKGTRSVSGKPGPNYWQNTALYKIDVKFDPTTRLVSGKVQINYKNNSPDTLRQIVFKLYPNLYKKSSVRSMPIADTADLISGMSVSNIAVNNAAASQRQVRTSGTNMMLSGVKIAPKSNADLSMDFSYTLNENSHIRQGAVDSGAFFIAYFFPRIAVYDDVDGWNMLPYLGPQEFYNDFCTFEINITVPKDYVVWSTGDLTNCSEVLQPEFCRRIEQAENQEHALYIIDSNDLKNGNITKQQAENTWKFMANNVTDIAFALSNHYLWQSSSLVVDPKLKRRTRVDAVFNKIHKDYFLVQNDAWKTVESMSYRFPKWPFPYSHMTVFDGLDQMEYPMMANDNPVEDRAESIELTTHEIFHMMFPFYMGTNETKYGWMDEGWATIGEWLITPMIDSSIIDLYGIDRTSAMMGTEYDMPIATTLTTHTTGVTAFANNYPKPALAYLYLKDMLGDSLFFKGLHTYIRNWNGRHPIPNDFFYSMNQGTGKDLNWYWKKWFFENGVVDLAIRSVTRKGTTNTITIYSKGDKPAPAHIEVTFADGSTQQLKRTAAVWEKTKLHTIVMASKSPIVKAEIKYSHLSDADFSNNVWPGK